jgi:uncharacterized membrane protein
MSFDVTILLAAITLDIAVVALAVHEYRVVRRDRHLHREADG